MNIRTTVMKLHLIALATLEPATSILFMGPSKLVNLYLDGVWKMLWRVLIEFYITVLQEGKITLSIYPFNFRATRYNSL